MESNIPSDLSEKQVAEFQREQLRRFKKRQLLELMLSNRERKAVAPEFPVSLATLSDWFNEEKPAAMGAQWLPAWSREIGPGLLRYLAKEAGYDLVEAGELGPVPVTDAGQLLALISTHHGRLVGQIIQAREDGQITDEERRQIWPEITRLIRELEAEAEYFRPLDRRRAAGGES
jgi:hypothetical protein